MSVIQKLIFWCGLSFFQFSFLTAYELHEWGTFTTVSGSDGGLLEGLEVEEESLPTFVHSHAGMRGLSSLYAYDSPDQINQYSANSHQVSVSMAQGDGNQTGYLRPYVAKGIELANVKNVTVKMETPVIYFYGNDTPKVNIKVGFHGGTISQWYPHRKSGDTPNRVPHGKYPLSSELKKIIGGREMVLLNEPIHFGDKANPYQGAIEWDVEILPKSDADAVLTFKPEENRTWIYPRVPSANVVKVGEEYEDFLFYRGLGNFEIPVTFSVDSSETVKITNRSNSEIPFAFTFENIGGAFRYKTMGAIAAGNTVTLAETEWTRPQDLAKQNSEIFQQMRLGLTAQGLNVDEANGMIKTWWKSYFRKPGLRVFWVVPQPFLEKILPLQASPPPARKVRVLVGRADIMRPKLEQQMIAELGTKAFQKFETDRFVTSYKNRLKQLVKEPVFQKFDAQNLANTQMMITAKKGSSSIGEGFYLSSVQDVKLQHLKLAGKWQIIGEDRLTIGDAIFQLDAKSGILTAKATADPDYEIYEIQLPKAL